MKAGKFPWLRIIHKYIKFSDFDNNLKDIWKIFLFEKRLDYHFSGTDTKLKEFAIAAFKFCDHFPTLTPLHLTALNGDLKMYQFIENNTILQDDNDITPLHLAAANGHLELVKYITNKVGD